MELKSKERRKKAVKMRFIVHHKNRPVNKSKKKKARLPLITAYKNLKHKNTALAKALTKQLEENKELRDEIIHLQSKMMHMSTECRKHIEAFARINHGVRESFGFLSKLVGTSELTITLCEQFTANNVNQQLDIDESVRRSNPSKVSSTKSPSCVVLPTVSGHTITKPTINLSRLNIQNVRHVQNLSAIEETSMPANDSTDTNTDSPTPNRNSTVNHVNIERRESRKLSKRTHLLNMSTDGDQSRLSDSIQLSQRKQSRSSFYENRLSNGTPDIRKSIIKSPRVQLKDVSKLLRNSQSVSAQKVVQRLSNVNKNNAREETRHSSSTSEQDSNQSFDSDNPHDGSASETTLSQTKCSTRDSSMTSFKYYLEKSSQSKMSTNFEKDDPLEGPSWKFENSLTTSSDQNVTNKSKHVESSYSEDSDEDETNKFSNFVNNQRGSIDIDDCTLFLRKNNNQQKPRFDINDLTLPNIIDTPMIAPSSIPQSDEMTLTFQAMTENIPAFTYPSNYMQDDVTTINIPRLSDITSKLRKESLCPNENVISGNIRRKSSNQLTNKNDSDEEADVSGCINKKKQKAYKTPEKDLSAAKVVLKKLKNVEKNSLSNGNITESEVNTSSSPLINVKRKVRTNRIPIIEDDSDSDYELPTKKRKKSTKIQKRKLDLQPKEEQHIQSTDSECSTESLLKSRPKRRVAPTNLQEPKINRKLRRSR